MVFPICLVLVDMLAIAPLLGMIEMYSLKQLFLMKSRLESQKCSFLPIPRFWGVWEEIQMSQRFGMVNHCHRPLVGII